ncbi:hypothetical protein F4604DRAFT_737567 [Suillus subluteus]|nr:hypothetical protein F4604DRAFT_737567 [Suillus subluteus]
MMGRLFCHHVFCASILGFFEVSRALAYKLCVINIRLLLESPRRHDVNPVLLDHFDVSASGPSCNVPAPRSF